MEKDGAGTQKGEQKEGGKEKLLLVAEFCMPLNLRKSFFPLLSNSQVSLFQLFTVQREA